MSRQTHLLHPLNYLSKHNTSHHTVFLPPIPFPIDNPIHLSTIGRKFTLKTQSVESYFRFKGFSPKTSPVGFENRPRTDPALLIDRSQFQIRYLQTTEFFFFVFGRVSYVIPYFFFFMLNVRMQVPICHFYCIINLSFMVHFE